MKYAILLLLLIAAFSGKGQIPPIYSPGMPPPLFDTVKSHQPKPLSDRDRLAALEKRVQYLDWAYTELRRRFDSLTVERKIGGTGIWLRPWMMDWGSSDIPWGPASHIKTDTVIQYNKWTHKNDTIISYIFPNASGLY